MIELPKAIQNDTWWEAEGTVMLDPEQIESVEQVYRKTVSGRRAPAFVLIVMRSGARHEVFEFLSKIKELMAQHVWETGRA